MSNQRPKQPKPKPRCANCGDETRFSTNNVDPRREKLQYCVPCFTAFNHHRRSKDDAWKDVGK